MGFQFDNSKQQRAYDAMMAEKAAAADAEIERGRREIAMKITMAVVDRVVNEIIRPGPKPEERECYVMAGELRAITPELETLVCQIIDVNDGID